MSKIPILRKAYPDELFYSWLYRTAKNNGLSFAVFADTYLGMQGYRVGELPPDAQKVFAGFYHSIYATIPANELFLQCSTFGFESIWMTEGQQARYINNVFYAKDTLNPPVNLLFSKIRICPQCMVEDAKNMGEPYLHRAHQLSGVTMCHKHHVPLWEYFGKRGHETEYNLSNYHEISSEIKPKSRCAYADYAAELFNANIEANIASVKELLYATLKSKVYSTTDNYASLAADLSSWQHNDLVRVDTADFLKAKMITANYIAPEEVLPLLMFLLPNAKDFALRIKRTSLLDNMICPACGYDYCTTPYARKIGFGCPHCDTKIGVQKRFERCIETVSSAYIPQEPLKNLDAKLALLHKTCGNVIKIKPRAFLFEGVRCPCEGVVTYADAQKTIEAFDGFELKEFTDTNSPVTIFNRKCGHTFQCRYHKFLRFPGCRVCKPKHMNAEIFEERIENLTQGEYEVIKGFTDQKTKVILRHKRCGQQQAYKPSAFLDGQRCKYCAKMDATWNDWYELACRYYHGRGNVDIPKRDAYAGKNLGLWLQKQRSEYEKGKLSVEQIQKLEVIGFTWDALETEWNRRYEQYKRYVVQNDDNPYISRRTDFEGEHLGAWVETQRKWYAAGKMSEERLQKLRAVNERFPEAKQGFSKIVKLNK